uniref:Uncharacterized protein n=1 Tax=Anopheles atroparvus TaxID=41427 RepID=A0A182J528_ANOAO
MERETLDPKPAELFAVRINLSDEVSHETNQQPSLSQNVTDVNVREREGTFPPPAQNELASSDGEPQRKMRVRCNVSHRQRSEAAVAGVEAAGAVTIKPKVLRGPSIAATASGEALREGASGVSGGENVGREAHRSTGARTRGRMSLGLAVLLVTLLGPAFDGRPSGVGVRGSEFPERECCDPVYPPMPDPDPAPGAANPTTTISSSSPFQTGQAGGEGGLGMGGGGGRESGTALGGGEHGGGGGGPAGTGPGNHLSSSRPMHIGYSGGGGGNGAVMYAGKVDPFVKWRKLALVRVEWS